MQRSLVQLACYICLGILSCLLVPEATASDKAARPKQAYVAIIIDDMGNHKSRGERAIKLPFPITFSVLPHTKFAHQLSKSAHHANREVMVHLPMENLGNQQALGPGGLTEALSKSEFLFRVDAAINKVPFASGLNNHTGSYLTQQTLQMNWLMKDMKARDFFFVDSRTTHKSVAAEIAAENAVSSASRDIFLDNEATLFEIHKSFLKLIEVARRKGTAIAIGHPYEATITYLESALPHLAAQNITILPASNLLALRQIQNTAALKDSQATAD